MNNTLKQVLLYTFIPIAVMAIIISIDKENHFTSPMAMLAIPGAYIVIGMGMLATNRTQMGKVLLLSGGLIVCLGLALFIYMLTTFHGC